MRGPGLWLGGIGSDVFGEFKQTQNIARDDIAEGMWN